MAAGETRRGAGASPGGARRGGATGGGAGPATAARAGAWWGTATRGGGWLHNMSVPSRSVLTCARAAVGGVRFQVNVVPAGYTADEQAWWLGEMHGCLQRHGAAALGATARAMREGPECGPRWVEKTASRWKGDAADWVRLELSTAIGSARLPQGLAVFVPQRAETPAGARAQVLDRLVSLAVLARRAGPLYLPQRPIEPSLIDLTAGVVIFPTDSTAERGRT